MVTIVDVKERVSSEGNSFVALIVQSDLEIVKSANGIPAAAFDMLNDSSKERVVSKRHVREMTHAAGIEYTSFTPYIVVGGAAALDYETDLISFAIRVKPR